MDSTMFWQIVVLVTYGILLSTALSLALCVLFFKMYPKLVKAMVRAMEESDDTLDDHYAGIPDPGYHIPPSLSRE